MRKTKIVATIGPATDKKYLLIKLLKAGANVFRLNASHGDLKYHQKIIRILKDLRKDFNFAILLDLPGPKIRTGNFYKDNIELKENEELELSCEENEFISDEKRIWINYKDLYKDVKLKDKILINDGAVVLEVVKIYYDKKSILCKIIQGSVITHKRGVNVPGVDLSMPSITEKDKMFIELGVKERIDYFALSFVRKEEDIEAAKSITNIPIVAKIETAKALMHLEDIVQTSDGVMVARGDLGVEIGVYEVPIYQKKIIKLANRYQKPVITATQMLESMVKTKNPTRAEVSDIANAIIDGIDALMLSSETSIGKYPEEAIKVMDKVSIMTEEYVKDNPSFEAFEKTQNTSLAIAHSSYILSKSLDTKLIIVATNTGSTAIYTSKRRPNIPIMGATNRIDTFYRLNLLYGVYSVLIPEYLNTDQMIEEVIKKAKELNLVSSRDKVIIVAGIPWGRYGTTNTVQIQEII